MPGRRHADPNCRAPDAAQRVALAKRCAVEPGPQLLWRKPGSRLLAERHEECRTASGTRNHSPGEAFFLDRATYLGRAAPWNPSAGPTFSPKSETPVTKPASAAAPLAEPPASFFSDSLNLAAKLTETFLAVRNETERRAAPLSPEDQLVQSMPDASPAKWHRAHTTWFFEQFLLGEHCPGYTPYHPDYAFLFNSYYVSAGPRHARAERGLLTRPGAEEVTAYREHVDAAIVKFFHEADETTLAGLVPLLEVGFNHEQQHQELMLTDILHAFAQNPIPPAYDSAWQFPALTRAGEEWITLNEGIHTIGQAGDSFCFDNEKPSHRALVGPVKLARNLVTNGEW